MIKCTIIKSVAKVNEDKISYEKEVETKVFTSVKSLNNYKDELVGRHELLVRVDIKELFFNSAELEDAIAPLAEKLDESVKAEIIAQVKKAFIVGCLVKRG